MEILKCCLAREFALNVFVIKCIYIRGIFILMLSKPVRYRIKDINFKGSVK